MKTRFRLTFDSCRAKPVKLRAFLLLPFFAPGLIAQDVATMSVVPPADSPATLHQTVKAIYPVRMMQEGITYGEAQLLLEIDRRGNLTDVLPIAYTQRAFAESALAAVREWHYDPPRVGGETVGLVADITFQFSVNGVLTIERRGGAQPAVLGDRQAGYTYQAHGLSRLDRLPQPVDIPAPVYPEEWAEDGRSGSVVVTFYIDESGQARVPLVQHDADEWLAAAAVTAVRKWRFAPCTFRGKPVLVCAQQEFKFDPKARKEALTAQ